MGALAFALAAAFISTQCSRGSKPTALEEEIRQLQEAIPNQHRFYISSENATPREVYIAHGGGINDYVYTNSVEAVLDSIRRNFKFIEIDMLVTSDKHIVGGHDWKYLKQAVGYSDTEETPLAFDEVKNLKIHGNLTVLSGKKIAEIMNDHPDCILVTDKIDDFDVLLAEIPYPDRMIVEVFSIEKYAEALRAGIKYPAFCLQKPDLVPVVEKYRIPLVTMNAPNFFTNGSDREIAKKLHNAGVTILLYNIEKCPMGADYFYDDMGKNISKIYSGQREPSQSNEN